MKNFSIGLAAICLGLWGSPASAQTASSSGFALDVNQTVTAPNVATVNVDIGPLAQTSGTAPPDYNVSNSVASVNQSIGLTSGPIVISENLSTGLLTSNSNGTATGAQATATVNNLSLGIGSTPFLSALFSISATTIESFSQADAIGGLSGTTTIEGLVLGGSIFGALVFDGSLFINPAPNTVLFSGGGLTITLNEQILSGNGITTNAINIGFNDFLLGTELKDGSIIIASTSASVTQGANGAVPEPATWAMMLIGFGAVGVSMRRRKKLHLAPQAA